MKTAFASVLAGAFLYLSCKTSEAPKPAGSTECSMDIRTAAIQRIVTTNCVNRGCHPGQTSPAIANFSTPDQLKNYISGNKVLFSAHVTSVDADMPGSQGFSPLGASTRDSIACWISNGMQD